MDRTGENTDPVRRPEGADSPRRPDQQHPAQEAHGGSMAPCLVDDTGHPVEPPPPTEPTD